MHYVVCTCFLTPSRAYTVAILYRTAANKRKISQQLLRVKMFLAVITKHSRDQHPLYKAVLEIQLLKKSLHSDLLLALWFGVLTHV